MMGHVVWGKARRHRSYCHAWSGRSFLGVHTGRAMEREGAMDPGKTGMAVKLDREGGGSEAHRGRVEFG